MSFIIGSNPFVLNTTDVVLKISQNAMTSFPVNGVVGTGVNLLVLDLSSNQLSTFVTDLTANLNLLELDLHNNNLTSFAPPGGIGLNSLLQRLDLSNNQLTTFNDNLTLNIALEYLNLSGNSGLASISAGTYTTLVACTYINFNGCALVVGMVDAILASANLAGAINGFLDLSGGTNAAPTGGNGNGNYQALIGNGWTVNIN